MASTPRSGGFAEVLLNYITGSFAQISVESTWSRYVTIKPHHNYGLALTFFRKGPADEVNFDLYLRNDLFSEEDGPHLLEQLIRIMECLPCESQRIRLGHDSVGSGSGGGRDKGIFQASGLSASSVRSKACIRFFEGAMRRDWRCAGDRMLRELC